MVDFFPTAENLPKEQKELISELGKLWLEDPLRPRPTQEAVMHWDAIISDWSKNASFPLYIRKQSLGRGAVMKHSSGRQVIPTDNSPAHWAFGQALGIQKLSLKDIAKQIDQDQIPVMFALRGGEKVNAKYRCTLSKLKKLNPNSASWTVRHIDPVGLKSRLNEVSLRDFDIHELQNHFRKFMSPSKMFVVRKEYAGLAEVPEFYQQMKS